MKTIDFIILMIVAVIIFFAIKPSFKHMKGEGGCCGGGDNTIEEPDKKLEQPIIGKITFKVEGMTCMNCSNRIKRALNRLEEVSATVNLKMKTVQVQYTKEIEKNELISIIENLGYEVKN